MLGFLAVAAPASAAPAAAGPAGPQTQDCTVNPNTPKRQLRAMWIASVQRLDWPTGAAVAAQQAEYVQMLDYAVAQRMNAVIVQVRPTADAFWPSALEPWSGYLTGVRGQDPGYDPLAFVVAEAHKRNLEIHAWFNPYRASMPAGSATSPEAGGDINKLAPNHPLRQHPEWAVVYPLNTPTQTRLYYNPGIPEVRAFVQDAVMDAVTKYDVDGVHFDDYFYPYPVLNQDFSDEATYAQYGAGFADKGDWRRNNIDLLIREMSDRIHAAKPWVKFGVSPFGIWRNKASDPLGSETNGTESYSANFADTRKWVKEGWLDYIVPQVYWHIGLPVANYAKLVPWWNDVVAGTDVHLYIGQANYKVNAQPAFPEWQDPIEISKHLTFNQGYPGVKGDIHFRAKIVMDDVIGSTTRFVTDHYSKPALLPAMPQLPAKPMMFPVVTGAQRDADTGAVTLRWHNTANGWPFGTAASYAVYRFDGSALPDACGFADATHLVATQRAVSGKTQAFVDTTAEPGKRYTYYVTALDRLWNESVASPPRFVF
jgi:uncharacterized lipoprotein YddW (UPF0748 family)